METLFEINEASTVRTWYCVQKKSSKMVNFVRSELASLQANALLGISAPVRPSINI